MKVASILSKYIVSKTLKVLFLSLCPLKIIEIMIKPIWFVELENAPPQPPHPPSLPHVPSRCSALKHAFWNLCPLSWARQTGRNSAPHSDSHLSSCAGFSRSINISYLMSDLYQLVRETNIYSDRTAVCNCKVLFHDDRADLKLFPYKLTQAPRSVCHWEIRKFIEIKFHIHTWAVLSCSFILSEVL